MILPFVAAGVLLSFEYGLRELVDREIPSPTPSAEVARISPGGALVIATARYPGSRLSMLELSDEEKPWYRVRQRRPGDLSRNWGISTLFVSVADGSILGDHPSTRAPFGRRLIDSLHPFHTSQLAGIAGRALMLLQGLWLIAMIMLGIRLWQRRRASGP